MIRRSILTTCVVILVGWLLSGCHSRIVGLRLDWDAPLRVHLLDGDREIVPEALEQRRLARLIESSVPRMRTIPGEPLEAAYRLRMVGQSPEGIRIESVFHLGPNWIGTGGRFAVLTRREAESMRQVIRLIREDAGGLDHESSRN